MLRSISRLAALPFILLVAACVATPLERLAITNVTVIVGDGSAPMPRQTVVVEDGRIIQVAAAAEHSSSATETIDGKGGFLVPGFVDTHAHLTLGPVSMVFEGDTPVMSMERLDTVVPKTAEVLLRHGVTTARDPGGIGAVAVAARARIASGEIVGPSLQVAGEVIDRVRFDNLVASVDSEEAIRAEVARQVATGVDWIKLYTTLEPALIAAAIDEAHEHGVKVTGHLQETTWTEATRLGIDSLVHIMPGSADLLPLAARDEYRKSMSTTLFMLRWFDLADVDSLAIDEMIEALVENQVSVDPTLIVLHSMAHGDDLAYTQNPALDLVAPELVTNWREFFHFNIGWSADHFRQARASYPGVARFTKLLFDRGVMLTAGTDANNPWIVPGDSFHRELELLVDTGIPPLDVLTIATRNGAVALGIEEETGTIEVGKRADLVLLRNDPTRDIKATRDIAWVMKGGVRQFARQ